MLHKKSLAVLTGVAVVAATCGGMIHHHKAALNK
jgi:hypothetical protein